MKLRFTIVFIWCLMVNSYAQLSDQEDIKNTFINYKSAILNSDGSEAVKWVDKHTLDYYADMLDLSQNGDSSTVADLGVLDKLMVLSVRHRVLASELLAMDGNTLFIYAIDKGMVGKGSVMQFSLGEIKVEGSFAIGEIITNGKVMPFAFHFYKEDEQWKMDLTSIFSVSNMAIMKVVEESEMSETEWIVMALGLSTGKQPTNAIWKPLKND